MENIQKNRDNFPQIICQEEHSEEVCSGQCDCACAASDLPNAEPSVPLTENHSYTLNDPFISVPLTPDYYAAIGRNSNLVVLNHSALTLARHFRNPRPLWQIHEDETALQSALAQMTELGLLIPDTYRAANSDEHSTTLSAWLHITDQCNLRCAYCYLPHTQAQMSLQTGRAAIDATFRSALKHGYQKIKLKYAGGEPLLRFEVVASLHNYAQTLADRHGISLHGVVLSNGTLLAPGIIEQMLLPDLRLMISLDGLGSFHDCQRSRADGHASSDAVLKATDMALSHGLIPDISITVSGRNAEGLPELMNWILERDLPFSINFYRENDFSASDAGLQLEDEKISEGMLAAYKILASHFPKRSLLNSLTDHAKFSVPHLRTCSVGNSYLVFDCHGRVAKCQMDMGHTITDVRDPDPLARIRECRDGIQNLTVDKKTECRECKWRYWCAGGCPLLTHRTTGRYDLKSPNCHIYQSLFPEIIRLEGLRLLYHHRG